MSIFTALLGPVADLGKTYLSNKAEEKQAKHEAKMSVIQNDSDWEAKMVDASVSVVEVKVFPPASSMLKAFSEFGIITVFKVNVKSKPPKL